MKRLRYLMAGIMAVATILFTGSALAQRSSSQVPVTYPGDTNETIARRAQWIEGAKKEGKVVWWSSVSPKELAALSAEFNKFYPFIQIEYWRGGPQEIATKLENELLGGRQTADTCWGGDAINFPRWYATGVLERFTDIIPQIKKWHPRTHEGYWATVGGNVASMQYNTKLVSPAEAPKHWEDLLQPKWKGQIGFVRDMNHWAVIALGQGGWGVEKTTDFLTKLKDQRPVYSQDLSAGHTLLVAGEYRVLALGLLWHVLASQKKGAPVEWVKNRPVVFSGSAAILMKKAPHPNAARLLLEWLLSPQGLKVVEAVTFKGSPYPGMDTVQAKLVEGLPFVDKDIEVIKKSAEMKLEDRLLDAIGGGG